MTAYLLIAVIVVQQIAHRLERKDLYNRIMSRDYYEYNAQNNRNNKKGISAHQRALNRWRGRTDDNR